VIEGAVLGLLGGLIVSSWQGFKDPPWEGFSGLKFVRSPLIAAVAGVAISIVRPADNPGVLVLAALAVERLAGEVYKGFLRPGFHAEYVGLFRRVGIPIAHRGARAACGAGALALGLVLYWGLGRFTAAVLGAWGVSALSAAIVGLTTGTVVAIGGALKDSQFEGFKPGKFTRSPLMSVPGAWVLLHASADPLVVAAAAIGFERVAVELYKTFLVRQVRGIPAGRVALYPHWFGRRWIFAVSFAAGASTTAWLLIAPLTGW
jgi:hypothetical protein